MSDGARTQLARLLHEAGLPATEADIDMQVATTFPVMQAAIETLHATPAARYEVPAVVFDADPPLAGWGDEEVAS